MREIKFRAWIKTKNIKQVVNKKLLSFEEILEKNFNISSSFNSLFEYSFFSSTLGGLFSSMLGFK